MAVLLKSEWGFLAEREADVRIPVKLRPGTGEEEALSVSGDSSLSSDDTQVAKAARLEGPERTDWEVPAPRGAAAPEPPRAWGPADAAALYNVGGWSEGYFAVTVEGTMAVRPRGGEWGAHHLGAGRGAQGPGRQPRG